ncbi:hypothetical protein [Paenibacillus harenae]|uniref:Uncharacterized protein n=1 Tax=Paenibacillus harenae TaxID=306543 RepID=A0ABT9U692_PAEHA|nr:hypothetical protein [Paenibacillus harenae]MDQ0115138.1 hypothetical protein [Paenibacillus harenae]
MLLSRARRIHSSWYAGLVPAVIGLELGNPDCVIAGDGISILPLMAGRG